MAQDTIRIQGRGTDLCALRPPLPAAPRAPTPPCASMVFRTRPHWSARPARCSNSYAVSDRIRGGHSQLLCSGSTGQGPVRRHAPVSDCNCGGHSQLPLLRRRWKQVLFGAMFQYCHGLGTQLAHRMHHPAAVPLHDVGFALLPVQQPPAASLTAPLSLREKLEQS